MKLIVIRHAAAIERTPQVLEEHRYLTPEGREFFRKTACTMAKKGIKPDLVLSSPLLRAVQTADIFAETIAFSGPLIITDELSPGFDLPGFRRLADSFGEFTEIAIVGHEPDLSSMVSLLLSIEGGFRFRKGSAIRLKLDSMLAGSGTFKWMASGKELISSRKEALGV
jgi:phosphohistidine phosphatase